MLKNFIKKLIMPATLAVLMLLGPVAQALEGESLPEPSFEPEQSAPALDPTEQPAEESSEPSEPSEPSEQPTNTPSGEDAQPPLAEPSQPPEEPVEGTLPAMMQEGEGYLIMGGHEPYLFGYDGGLFKPKNTMTRAEVCQMLYNLLKEKPDETSNNFTDVKVGKWYEPAVSAMCTLGVVDDTEGGEYGPNQQVSRAEFVVMLSRCVPMKPGETTFSDVPKDHPAYEAISSAQNMGWIDGFSDGSFKPDDSIQRCQAVKVMNIVLDRKGEGYAADRDQQKFKDVGKSFWAFLDITEAAAAPVTPEPTQTPDPTSAPNVDQLPDGTKVGSIVKVNAATGLNIRKAPVDGEVITAVANGTLLTVTDISKYPWLGVKTSSGISGYSSAEFLTLYTGNPNGGSPGNGTISATSLTVRQYRSVRLDANTNGNINAMTWTSTNPDVARVGYTINYNSKEQSAIVYAGAPGTATLSFKDGTGVVRASCSVTVTEPVPVRFAYAEGNIVALNKDFDLVAITDPSRDEVRFEIVDGPAKGSFTSSAYEEEKKESGHGLPTNYTRVFRRTVKFGATGMYTVKAYASSNGVYSSEAYTFTVQVNPTLDYTTATFDSRRMSGKGIEMLAGFEGFVSEVEDDILVSGNPTVGYGFVIQEANETFYNNMTKTEAYAMLVNTVNGDVYARDTEKFRAKYNIKMNQAQFDALVSFAYNCGTGVFNVDKYDTPNIILNMVTPPTDASPSNPYHGVHNSEAKPIYAQPDYTSTQVITVPEGGSLTVVGTKINRSSVKQEVWYRVTYGGKTGWMPSGYVKLSGNVTHDLTYADSTSFANELLQWHMGAGQHLPGLLYRRLCESKVFFFSNYDEGIENYSTTYRVNRYGFLYPACCRYLDKRS